VATLRYTTIFYLYWLLRAIYRPIATTTTCLHPSLSWASSSPLFNPNLDASFVILSFHRCLGRPLGLRYTANPINCSNNPFKRIVTVYWFTWRKVWVCVWILFYSSWSPLQTLLGLSVPHEGPKVLQPHHTFNGLVHQYALPIRTYLRGEGGYRDQIPPPKAQCFSYKYIKYWIKFWKIPKQIRQNMYIQVHPFPVIHF